MKCKVVIFGAWQEGIDLFFEIRDMVDVVAFIDNNPKIHSQEIYGIRIMSPNELEQIEYDEIFISSSKRYHQMQIQLLELGIKKTSIKILFPANTIKTDLRMYHNHLRQVLDSYEKYWINLKSKYNKISLCMLDVSTIGELVTRLWLMVEDEELLIGRSVLRIYIPTLGKGKRVCNQELVKLAQERLNIVSDIDYEFWMYVLDVHRNEVDIFDYSKYLYRGERKNRIIQNDYVFARFRESKIEFGKKSMAAMGIRGKYVCMAARSSAYAKSSIKDKSLMQANITAHEFRNSEFNDYCDTISYLKSINIQAVRMGRGEEPIGDIDNCIDYAGLYADDFMDIFLMAHCEFAIVGGGSGIYTLATSYGRPVLFVNHTSLTIGNGGEYHTENDMYIPKKVFSKNKGRYLTLLEIAEVENVCFVNGSLFEKNGITFMNNSSEEILEATKEILGRINGQWKDTEEDIRIKHRYEVIMEIANNRSINNIHNWIGGAFFRRISTIYIKKNMYLLNESEVC